MLLTKPVVITPASQRIDVIDVLRGFALLGIVLVHYSIEFAGWSSVYTSSVSEASLPTAYADSAVTFLLNLFLVSKSRALFALLFGVGFYYQLAKAKNAGHAIEKRFAKRMLALLAVGIAHAYVIWSGDILRMYAVCGLVLLVMYRWRTKSLFVLAIILSVLAPAVATLLHYHFHYSPISEAMKIEMYNGYAGNGNTSLWRANWLRDAAITWDALSVCSLWLPVLGNFILGYLAAKRNLFSKLSQNKALLLRCLFVSGLLAFLCSNSFVRIVAKAIGSSEDAIPSNWHDLLTLPASFSVEAMAFFLLCVVIYLYGKPMFQRLFSVFRFAGRMTLTNYILQSLFGVFFFYGAGLGFISRYGSLVAFCIAVLFFMAQLLYSKIWLQNFAMGPVEWLWRSLAEGKFLSIKIEGIKSKNSKVKSKK